MPMLNQPQAGIRKIEKLFRETGLRLVQMHWLWNPVHIFSLSLVRWLNVRSADAFAVWTFFRNLLDNLDAVGSRKREDTETNASNGVELSILFMNL